MNKEKNIFTLLYKIELIIGIITSILLLYYYKYDDIKNLWLLPMSYTLSMFFVRDYYYQKNIGIAVSIFELTKFIRYIVLPIVYNVSGGLVGLFMVDLRYDYHEFAVGLMCYELLAVSLVFFLYHKKHYSSKRKTKLIIPEYNPKVTVFIFSFLWLALILLVGSYRDYLLNFSLAQNSDAQTKDISNNNLDILFQFGKIYIYAIFIYLASLSKSNRRKIAILFFASVLFISSNWNDGGLSVNRWGLIVSSLLSLYAVYSFYPNKKRQIFTYGAIIMFLIVILGTVIKMVMVWDYGKMDANETAGSMFASGMIDVYFEGVYSVSNGLSTVDSYGNKVGFMNFISEFIYHFPFAVRVFGLQDYTWAEYYFKLGVDDTSLICPTLVQSCYYFGPLGCPFFSCVSVFFALLFTSKLEKERDFTVKLLYVYAIFWLSLYNCIDYTIVEAHIWYPIIGIWICRLGKTKRRNDVPSNIERVFNKELI